MTEATIFHIYPDTEGQPPEKIAAPYDLRLFCVDAGIRIRAYQPWTTSAHGIDGWYYRPPSKVPADKTLVPVAMPRELLDQLALALFYYGPERTGKLLELVAKYGGAELVEVNYKRPNAAVLE